MRRPWTRLLVAIGGAVGIVSIAGGAIRWMTTTGSAVATFEVTSGRFLREAWGLGSLQAVKATPILVPAQSRQPQKIAFIARDGTAVQAGDVLVLFDPYDAERTAADGRSDAGSAARSLEKTDAEGKRTRKGLELDQRIAKDELDRAERFELRDTTIFSRYELVESSINKDLAARKADASARRSVASDALTAANLAVGRVEADKAQLRLRQADEVLSALRVEAPHDGFLILERSWMGETTNVGSTVFPGMKLGELPDLSLLEAKVHVLEADAAGLVPGLPATVEIEGRPGQSWAGKVARVDPIAKPRARQSPVKYFECVVSLDETDIEVMRPGQRVRARIRLEDVDGVLAVPRGALFESDGKRVVYRRQATGAFLPVEVEVGRNSVSRIVIEKGLSAGDRIALRDPTKRDREPADEAAAGEEPSR